ncbi:hypothetical protein HanIR_Chr13g0658781 [Helianthus annuus]|nr:hypothetical protein HanIR_Chr13g0658781 [Helianthus annuus]
MVNQQITAPKPLCLVSPLCLAVVAVGGGCTVVETQNGRVVGGCFGGVRR